MKRLSVLLMLLSSNAYADNEGLKRCLEMNNYSPKKFDTFDFSAAAACNSDFIIAKEKEKLKELREFLKERPWYKGRDWQWEDCAKTNRCTRRYSWWSLKEN